MTLKKRFGWGVGLAAGVFALAVPVIASAQVKIGVTISQTGPAASLGIPEAQTVALLPKEADGTKIQYIVLDDGTNPTRAVQNAQALINDDHVDAIIGSSTTPTSLAMVSTVAKAKTPMVAVAPFLPPPSKAISGPLEWAFQSPQPISLMASVLVHGMAAQHVKTLGFIGFSDGYGQDWLDNIRALVGEKGIKLVDVERYARNDTSVTGQVLRLMGANPDAILIAASSSPAVLPQQALKRSGYKGIIYQTGGAANNAVLQLCGADCNGMFLDASPLLVAQQLPEDYPVKKTSLAYFNAFEAKYGKGSVNQFGGNFWDAGQLILHAIPVALKSGARPGTEAFRVALRDAIEHTTGLAASEGVFNLSPTFHGGPMKAAMVMIEVVDGKWKYRPDLTPASQR
ncbi:MAG TPA: ABC transporter substrate-binding protein [Nevskiaceae bacterium]